MGYWKAQRREGTKEIFPSMATVQKPGGGKFIKPGAKTGAKSVEKWKLQAAQAKKEAAKFNLKQTLKQTDKSLEKLKKTTDRIKWYQKAANKKRYSDDFYKGKK